MNIRLRIQADGQSRDFVHAGTPVTIGRAPAATIVLEETAPTSVVSWDHARIDLGPAEATITDLRSSNGTYRNNERVQGTAPLRPGDVLRLGLSGPVLTVTLIDLSPEPAALPAKPAARAAGAPVAVATPVVAKPARPKAKAPPPVSETRGIALEAVKELKAQQAAHARQKNALVTAICAGLLLAMLLALGLWTQRDRIGHLVGVTRKMEGDIAETKGELEQLGRDVRRTAVETADRFAGFASTLEEHRRADADRDRKLDAMAKQQIDQAAQLRGGIDKLKQELGASLDQINSRLVKTPDKMPDPQPPANRPSARIEPGMKMDVLVKNKGFYSGVFLGIEGTRVRLQTNHNAGARPVEWDIRDVQAFQTRDGIFAYDEATATFEPALTFYRFDKSADHFVRLDGGSDTFLAQDAQVLGAMKSAKALLSVGPAGELCVGLPVPVSKSPPAIPRYLIEEVVTAQGVWSYDDRKKAYECKLHKTIAAEAQKQRDDYWKQRDLQQWERRVKSYELGTERLKALSPYLWRRWWWW